MRRYGYLARTEKQLDQAGVQHVLYDKVFPKGIKILIYLIDFTYYYKNIRINTSKNTLKIKNL